MPNPKQKSKAIMRKKKSKTRAPSKPVLATKSPKRITSKTKSKSPKLSSKSPRKGLGRKSNHRNSSLSSGPRNRAFRSAKSATKSSYSSSRSSSGGGASTAISAARKAAAKSKTAGSARTRKTKVSSSGKITLRRIRSSVTNATAKVWIPKEVGGRIKRIQMLPGATVVKQEAAMQNSGYVIEQYILGITEYSQIMRARFVPPGQRKSPGAAMTVDESYYMSQMQASAPPSLAVKVTNLTECSPRFRANLLKNSVRIMRAVGRQRRSAATETIFMRIYEIFQVESVKLYVFMEECQPQPTLYDLVKMADPIPVEDVRDYAKAISMGVLALQKKGIAHRYLKLQHILFDQNNRPKLCGWSKSVFFYDLNVRRFLLQHSERRVRRNYYLPPEAFLKPYDPSKADIWSIGVLLITMCSKRYPFNVRDEVTPFSAQWVDFKRKHELNEYVRNLCDKIFVDDPKQRITCVKLLEHSYFRVAKAKLEPLSLYCDQDMFDHEMSRVGALSGIEFNFDQAKQADGIDGMWCDQLAAEIDGKTQRMMRNNTKVGEEGQDICTPEDAMNESHKAEMMAPEETETMAMPYETYMEEGGYEQHQ